MRTVLTFCEEDGRRSFPMIIEGICRFARTRHWHIENLSAKDQVMKIDRLLDFWRPTGCIAETGPVSALPRAAFGRVPVVFFNRDPREADGGASVVEMDHAACVKMALDELRAGRPAGFGFVPFRISSRSWSQTRQRAFCELLADEGLSFEVFHPRGGAELQRVAFIRQLKTWLRKLPKPCGILAANDETASVVSVACAMVGLRIPDDISLIGIDDDPTICLNADPPLSSVRPNFARGAYLAARLLDRAIRHPSWPGRHVVYPPEGVTRRNSTRILLRRDSEVAAAVAFIQAKACTSITADDVRRTFSCAPRTADARFRASTRQSILEMIHEVRLRRMKDLLANPRQQLDAVANLCGYASQNAACRFFRLKTGTTMTRWRQRHLGPHADRAP